MSTLDTLSSASVSRNLRHLERFCPVDVLGAAGVASIVTGDALVLFRLKYLNDYSPAVKALFTKQALRSAKRRKVNPSSSEALGEQAMVYWVGQPCSHCHGRKYQSIRGTPNLSTALCQSCNGTGKTTLHAKGNDREVVRDVIDWATSAIQYLDEMINRKLH